MTTRKTVELDDSVAAILQHHKTEAGYKSFSELINRVLGVYSETLEQHYETEIDEL
jgi:predicted CopG family antitoxin